MGKSVSCDVRSNPIREVPNILPISEIYGGYEINIKNISRKVHYNKSTEPASLIQ